MNNFYTTHDMRVFFTQFATVLWTTKTGGTSQGEVTQVFPGGGSAPVNVPGPRTVEAVTLGKPHDPVVDRALLAWAQAWDRGQRRPLTLVCQPVDAAGVPIPGAIPTTYYSCAKVSLKMPDVGRGSADAAMIELVVQPESMSAA